MPIPLGRSVRVPSYLVSQIVHGVSTFFLILAVVYLIQKAFAFTAAQFFTAPYVHESLLKYFPLQVTDLFMVSHNGSNSALSFFFMHIITAFVCSFPWSSLINRGKRVRDFVFTFFAIYYIVSVFISHKIIPSKSYTVTLVSAGLLSGHMTKMRVEEEERAEIPLSDCPKDADV